MLSLTTAWIHDRRAVLEKPISKAEARRENPSAADAVLDSVDLPPNSTSRFVIVGGLLDRCTGLRSGGLI